jgi:hypothetical protein
MCNAKISDGPLRRKIVRSQRATPVIASPGDAPTNT